MNREAPAVAPVLTSRKTGFYWVKMRLWTIALLRREGSVEWWLVPGVALHYRASDFDEIGPYLGEEPEG